MIDYERMAELHKTIKEAAWRLGFDVQQVSIEHALNDDYPLFTIELAQTVATKRERAGEVTTTEISLR